MRAGRPGLSGPTEGALRGPPSLPEPQPQFSSTRRSPPPWPSFLQEPPGLVGSSEFFFLDLGDQAAGRVNP